MATEYGPATVWGVMIALGVATFGIRASFVHLFGRIDEVPDRVTNALRFVPPAVFAALTLPAIVAPEGAIAIVGNERVAAAVVAAAVAWFVDDILATILAGMAAFWALRFGF
ncbi:AzlD domain-containing protein [Halobellus ruber]|uniref:AzlD domain-containing protein n=1 Tax=Halobellus ruber TaxID=2761102 RepID=A0A7J9SKT6_9EURY|nr:AzlD domain-containing protein [Halobellus ruber]MBB6646993.1 AzlD domain-containing protein [Halobellus ruber]